MDHLSLIVKQVQVSFLERLVKINEPFECCAILLGIRDKSEFFVQEIIPTHNEESSRVRFTIDDNRLFEIYKMADEKNLSVIGIFHSHPSVPYPSQTDKTYMKINPIPWIIKSTITNEMRCFIVDDQSNGNDTLIDEIEIKIKD
jgi:proteasome lid subunit RPN8/RPN11